MNDEKKLERNIYLYYIVDFLTALLFIIPVWVAFERRILTFTEMALFTAICAGVSLSLEVPTGALADLLGRKVTMMLGWAINGIGFTIEAFAPSPGMFLCAFITMGVGTALVSGADVALIFDSLKVLKKEEEFSRFMSRSKLLYRIGLAIATFLGGWVYSIIIRLPYFLISLTNFLAIIFIFFMFEPAIEREKFSFTGYKRQIREGFKEITKNTYMKKLTLYYMLVG